MLSLRLQTILEFVDKDASVIDIGTDHGYIPISLVQNKITTCVMATDVSSNALASAFQNIQKEGLEHIIQTKVSDGFLQVDKMFDIAILAGMGTTTMKNILKSDLVPKTLILQSNNDLDDLRLFMNELGYTLCREKVVLDTGKYYSVMKYVLGKETLSKEEILFGKSNNLDYFHYLLNMYKELYQKSKLEKFNDAYLLLNEFIGKIQARN